MNNQKIKKNYIDGIKIHNEKKESCFVDFSIAKSFCENRQSSILFSRKRVSHSFLTEDSKLYITPDEFRRWRNNEMSVKTESCFDSALSRNWRQNKVYAINRKDLLYLSIRRRYGSWKNYLQDSVQGSVQGVSMVKMWNLSIVGAVIFGMFTMTMIYRYLGQGVSAALKETASENKNKTLEIEDDSVLINVLDYEEIKKEGNQEIDTSFVTKLLQDSAEKKEDEFEKELREMVKGYPIEVMIPEIAKKDRIVATFIVAIAKKESNWGKRVPVLDGKDCYNYWGYRGVRDRMGTGGHTCFDNPKDAVDTVAKRIDFLVYNKKLNTPDKMVIWKCGSNCAVTGGQAAANKWISDVSLYFDKLNKKGD